MKVIIRQFSASSPGDPSVSFLDINGSSITEEVVRACLVSIKYCSDLDNAQQVVDEHTHRSEFKISSDSACIWFEERQTNVFMSIWGQPPT